VHWKKNYHLNPPAECLFQILAADSAGQIAYALAPLIASGQMLGPDTPVLLQLYDVPAAEGLLQVCYAFNHNR
jgi:hypothetical protein